MTNNRVSGGVATEVPSRDWRDRGIHLRVSLTPNEPSRRELLVVVATRTPVGFTPIQDTDASASLPRCAKS